MAHKVIAIPGDGIGPEVMEAVKAVMKAVDAPVEFETLQAGLAALEGPEGELLPESTVEAIRSCGLALKGPCTTPIGTGFRSVNVQLRQALQLYAAVRPVRSMPGVKTRYENVDLVIVRENTEGLYSGVENAITEGVVASMKVATRKGCHRIAKWTFRYATFARCRFDESGHAQRLPSDRQMDISLCNAAAPQEGDGVPQGQHHEDD